MKQAAKKLLGIAGIIVFTLTTNPLKAQNSQNRSLDPFIEAIIEGDFEVVFQAGQNPEIKLTTKGIDLEEVETSVNGGKLTVKRKVKLKNAFKESGVKITIVYQDLSQITGDEGCNIQITNLWKGKLLKVHMKGSGSFAAKVDAEFLDTKATGSSSVFLEGEVVSQEISITGSANVSASKLESEQANVNIKGTGDAEVWVTQKLTAKLTGTGNVYYAHDKPAEISSKMIGSGKILEMKQ